MPSDQPSDKGAEPQWIPDKDRIEASHTTRFIRQAEKDWGLELADWWALQEWSAEQPAQFFLSLWDFGEIRAETRGDRVLIDADKMPGARWFPDAKLNFAENLLRRRDDTPALIFQGEDQIRSETTHAELYALTSRIAQALLKEGVEPGDRVVGFMPNIPETVAAMLAAASLGAVWSSCSPDFGVKGVMDRFGQIEPTILFAADGYFYNGKRHDSLERLREITAQLDSLKRIVVVSYTEDDPSLEGLPLAVSLDDFIAPYHEGEIAFRQLPFNHPIYIMYSSGTTGEPKCIVHGAGGTLIQNLKEQLLHTDIRPGDRVFYFTTCGWMMWNWLASALTCEATLILYDGSPFYPDANAMWDLAEREKFDIFGTSPKFLDAANKAGVEPIKSHDLSTVRTILSTGSPLAPAVFDYVYEKVKSDVRLSSIAGGTDILGCFCSGSDLLPVYRGEIQTRTLGMTVEVLDDEGRPIREQKGELVCTKSFPSMPIKFWDDPGDQKYRAAYFEKFPNIWTHGDFVELTKHGGMVIYGRSDAVLNPGGVRIGTAEIYRQVERMEEVEEGLCIGQIWDNDTRVILFVRLREGLTLSDELQNRIRLRIRENATPRHVPEKIIQVSDIPRTISGKITELAVRDIIHGRPVNNRDALANPEALEFYRDLPDLQS